MKKIFLILVMFFCLAVFSQGPTVPVIFEFNNKTDEIVFKEINSKKEVSGFKILLGKKKIFFSASQLSISNKKQINTSRENLIKTIEQDNFNKSSKYFIFLKKENKYYSIDHIARKIQCE